MSTATAPMPPVDDATHLRWLVEAQPGCLMRADFDGRLLAVNAAALRLLGAYDLEAVLARTMYEFLDADDRPQWREFATRVARGATTSVECRLIDLEGRARTLLFQGVPLPEHPDGIASMLLTAHDMTRVRRLEEALEARTREGEAHSRAIAALKAETLRLQTLLDERQQAIQGALLTLDAPRSGVGPDARQAAVSSR